MASRENQGLHIALILLVMLTVGLCVLSFVFYSKAENRRAEAESDKNQRAQAEAAERSANFKVQALEYMIKGEGKSWKDLEDKMVNILGTSEEIGSKFPELTQIHRSWVNNMKLYGEDSTQFHNYESLPKFLLSRVRDQNEELIKKRRELTQLTQERQDLQKNADQKISEAEAARDQARNDLTAERDKFTKDLGDLRKQMEGIASQLSEKDTRIVDLNNQLDEQRSDFNERIKKLATTVDDQRNLIRKLRGDNFFEVPDAIVTTVNQKEGVLYIDVGSADNLKVQQTFSVFDKGTTGVVNAKPKGRVEVLQVLGDHVAMCRVLDDQVTNIIVPGDLIFTPVWSPGERIHFAITGFIDITGSGQNDADLLTRLIELNGGVVDDEVSVQTRYLVQGENRGATPDAEADSEMKDDFDKKIAAAVEIGVDRMSPDKLLLLMGWRADVSTITLGSGSTIDIPKSKPEEPEDPFRKRTPPRGTDGAF